MTDAQNQSSSRGTVAESTRGCCIAPQPVPQDTAIRQFQMGLAEILSGKKLQGALHAL